MLESVPTSQFLLENTVQVNNWCSHWNRVAADCLDRNIDIRRQGKALMICKVAEEEFDFLGHAFGRLYSTRSGKAYLGMRPSRKSVKRLVEKIYAMTALSLSWLDTTEMVMRLISKGFQANLFNQYA